MGMMAWELNSFLVPAPCGAARTPRLSCSAGFARAVALIFAESYRRSIVLASRPPLRAPGLSDIAPS